MSEFEHHQIEKFIPEPGTDTLKLMYLNRALATGDHEYINKVQAFIDKAEIVDDSLELGDLKPNQITRKDFIIAAGLSGEVK